MKAFYACNATPHPQTLRFAKLAQSVIAPVLCGQDLRDRGRRRKRPDHVTL